MTQFLAELKRRHVWRVAIAYAVAAWLLLQLAAIVLPTFDAPHWVLKVLIGVFVLFFPIALIVAWAFEMTPEGVRRTEPAHSEDALPAAAGRRIGRRIDFAIIAILAAAVGVLAWQLTTKSHPVAAPMASVIPAKSIAVLPFENLNVDKQDAYFVAGMQDLILTKLADIGDLKVIARTSTAQYNSHPDDLGPIAQQLGVATILEGSVQKVGNEVLVNVQLINAKTNDHIWAQSYQRTLDKVFSVEGEVAGKVAAALKAKLSPVETQRLATSLSPDNAANDLFLRAEYFVNRGITNYDTASLSAAIPLYRQAIQQDGNFALARARLSYAESALAWFGGSGEDIKQLRAGARAQAEQALALQPDLAEAQIALGYSDYWGRGDYAGALKAFAAGLALRPSDADALAAQGYVERRQGRFDAAIVSLQKALALDPRNSSLAYELGGTIMQVGRYAEAEQTFQRALAIDPSNVQAKGFYADSIAYDSGDLARALAALQGTTEPFLQRQRMLLLTWQRRYRDALAVLETIPDTPDNFPFINGSKAVQQGNLYRLLSDQVQAQPLYAKALSEARVQLAVFAGSDIELAFVWHYVADAELGLGHTATSLAAIDKSQALAERSGDHVYGKVVMGRNATLYAEAGRADLAVPLLTKVFATPGIGYAYSPVLLWLDPVWDPIREDPRFQALLKEYAKYKPTAAATAAPGTSSP